MGSSASGTIQLALAAEHTSENCTGNGPVHGAARGDLAETDYEASSSGWPVQDGGIRTSVASLLYPTASN